LLREDSTMRTVMLIGAHPDDEISAGGTLAKHSRAGDRVVIVTMTKGGMGHHTMPVEELVRVREVEAGNAARTLGAELMLLDYDDGAVPASREVALRLAKLIREIRPDVLLTHSSETLHPDHNNTLQNVKDGFFLASLPLLDLGAPHFDVPLVLQFAQSIFRRYPVYVDIRDTLDTKITAADCHASQYGDWLSKGGASVDGGWDVHYHEAFRMEARIFGGHCGIEYAEAFDYLREPDPVALDLLP
jgi:N-acetylglucosamine malate deacetylase 1